jgi:hypothetical protein
MTERIVFVDCETTTLSPNTGEIWELALLDGDQTIEFMLPVDLAKADPSSLRVGRFYERRWPLTGLGSSNVGRLCRVRWDAEKKWEPTDAAWAAAAVAHRLDGVRMGGACPWFDASFLERWLRAHGQAPTWHHRLVDVENRVAGALGLDEENPKLSDCARLMGIPVDEDAQHTALYDALLARDIYDAVRTGAREGAAA